jgi:hypothetical protein
MIDSLTFPQLVERWTQIAPRVFAGEMTAVASMRTIEQALMQRVDTSLHDYLWTVLGLADVDAQLLETRRLFDADLERVGPKGLRVYIYDTPAFSNSSNGGISSRVKAATLVEFDGHPVEGPFSPGRDAPAIKIVKRMIGGGYLHAEPLERGEGAGPMMGGAFVYSSDSRFRELAAYPVPLHDRWERRS